MDIHLIRTLGKLWGEKGEGLGSKLAPRFQEEEMVPRSKTFRSGFSLCRCWQTWAPRH